MKLKIGSLQAATGVEIVTSLGLHVNQWMRDKINYNSVSTDSNPLGFCKQKVVRVIQSVVVEFWSFLVRGLYRSS